MGYKATGITGIGDPFVLNDNGTYYMYATSSGDGIAVWKGTDLNNLQKVGLCYFKQDSFGYDNFWAPEVVKRADGKYVMHFTARDRADKVLRTGAAVADSPLGPFQDARSGKPMFVTDTATIDASCFVDEDGQGYLYYVKDCSNNVVDGVHTSQVYVVKLNNELTEVVGEAQLVATPTKSWESKSLGAPLMVLMEDNKWYESHDSYVWNEGPSVIKHNGRYYLTYSANCFDSRNYLVGAAVADSPMGPFVKYDEPVMSYIEGELSGPGHNSFFVDNAGKLMCAFHAHTHYDKPSGDRRFCYCEVAFEKGKLKLLYK